MTKIGAEAMPVCSELRLLMALARANPGGELLEAADRLAAGPLDWQRLHALAVRNRVVGLLAAVIERRYADRVPETVLVDFRRSAARTRMIGMLLLSTQLSLSEQVLEPLGVRFAVFKGAALSARWYGDPLARQVSDIDLLVEEGRITEVVEAMLAQGWQIVGPFWKGQRLAQFVRYVGVVELELPDGRRAEIHRLIDGSGIIFTASALLKRVTQLQMNHRSVPVLDVRDELLVMMFHHARHRWCCFHWVADLVSMINSPTLSAQRLQEASRHPLLGPTVQAAIDLAHDIDAMVLTGEARLHSPFLARMLDSIARTEAPGQNTQLDPRDMEPDFPEPWQRTARYRALIQLDRLRPNLSDLDWWQPPAALTWLHWFSRPLRVVAGWRRSRPRD